MASRLQTVLDFAARVSRRKRGRFSFAKAGPVTVIDLDGRALHVVQSTRRGGKTEFTRCATEVLERSFQMPSTDLAADAKCLSEALGRLKLKPGAVAMTVPRSLVFLRTLILPAAGTIEELASMVHFQVAKDLPFRPEDAVIDFTVLRTLAVPGTPSAGESKAVAPSAEAAPALEKKEVLAAVIKKDLVEHYSRLAEAAGLRLVSLGLRSSANAKCVAASGAASGHQAVALVSTRAEDVTIDVIVGQSLVFSRVTSVASARENTAAAGETVPEAQASLPALAPGPADAGYVQTVTMELLRSLHSYDAMADRRPVEKILVAGAAGIEQELIEALARRFGIPCGVLSPAAFEEIPNGAGQNAGVLSGIGLALGIHDPDGLPVDFLNAKRPPPPRNWRRIKLAAAACAGAILFFSLFGIRSHWIKQKLQVKDQVQTQVSQAEKNRVAYRDMRLKAKTVREWTAEGKNWLDHYAFLSLLLPPSQDVYITALSTGARGVIHLSVQARSGEILAQMDKRLREAGYEVKPLAITPGVDKFGYPFRSSVELTLPAKMKMELSALKAETRPPDDRSLDPPAPTRRTVTEKPPPPASAPSGGSEEPPRRGRRGKP